jgi:hypothetical protein
MQEQTSSVAEQENTADGCIITLLLNECDQRPWSVEELIRDRGNDLDTRDSVARLRGLGLVHLTVDGLVFPTRAALHMDRIAT